MKHPREEELIAYHDGDAVLREVLAGHVGQCAECRAELERIDSLLAAVMAIPVPHPGDDYGQRVWRQIALRLPEKRARWWDLAGSHERPAGLRGTGKTHAWFATRRLAAWCSVALLVLAALWAGRYTGTVEPLEGAMDWGKVRERVLVAAAGEHLGRSERMLVELANAESADAHEKPVNISAEQRRAESLLEENRLYRETAMQDGDSGLANVLDQLERVLLDVAHSPPEVSAAQLESIRQRIESGGILFKVRVFSKELQQRSEKPSPAQNGLKKEERNTV